MDETLPYPKWAFDFISVHGHKETGYTLVSPRCLVEKYGVNGRPEFEKETFSRKCDAIKRAIELAKINACFVIDCVEKVKPFV